MKTIRKWVLLTRVLAVLCLIAGLFSHLALTDIAHGELDVSEEWLILRITAVLIGLFIISTLITLRLCTRVLNRKA